MRAFCYVFFNRTNCCEGLSVAFLGFIVWLFLPLQQIQQLYQESWQFSHLVPKTLQEF